MNIKKQDWVFIGIAITVLAIFIAITGEEKTKKVPLNETHKQFNELVKLKGKAGKKEADIFCPQCHNEKGGVPFPAGHPVKPKDGPMGCHLCHKFQKQ
jgi:hypothetical protein